MQNQNEIKLQQQITLLTRALTEAREDVRRHERQHKDDLIKKENDLKDAQGGLSRERNRQLELEQQLRDIRKEHSKLQQEHQKLVHLPDAYEEQRNRIKRLEADVTKYRENATTLKKDCDALKVQHAALETEKAALQATHEKLDRLSNEALRLLVLYYVKQPVPERTALSPELQSLLETVRRRMFH